MLAALDRSLFSGILSALREIKSEEIDGGLIDTPVEDRPSVWAGREVEVAVRPTKPTDPAPAAPVPEPAYPSRERQEHPKATVAPSTIEAKDCALELELAAPVEIGTPIPLVEGADVHAVGNAVHAFFASDSPTRAPHRRLADATTLLSAWGAEGALPADALVTSADALLSWIEQIWPDARKLREWPIMHRLAKGSVVRGSVDLVLELDDRLVVIDHKCIGGDLAQVLERAAGYRGQLTAYAAALSAATGKRVESLWLHLPLNGRVVAATGQQRRGYPG